MPSCWSPSASASAILHPHCEADGRLACCCRCGRVEFAASSRRVLRARASALELAPRPAGRGPRVATRSMRALMSLHLRRARLHSLLPPASLCVRVASARKARNGQAPVPLVPCRSCDHSYTTFTFTFTLFVSRINTTSAIHSRSYRLVAQESQCGAARHLRVARRVLNARLRRRRPRRRRPLDADPVRLNSAHYAMLVAH